MAYEDDDWEPYSDTAEPDTPEEPPEPAPEPEPAPPPPPPVQVAEADTGTRTDATEDDWEPYKPPAAAAAPTDDWEPYKPDAAIDKPRGVPERVMGGWKAGFGDEPLGMSPETQQKMPLLQGFQPFAAAADALVRGLPALANAGLGWVAGMLERNPDALIPYGFSPAWSDRLQRDFGIVAQGLMIEPGMGPAASALHGEAVRRANIGPERPPAPPPPPPIEHAPGPAQGQLPFGQGQTPYPYDVRTGGDPLARAQIGGGERQLGLPLDQEAPPPGRPGLSVQPELGLEPPPVVDAEGQLGFNIQAPDPRNASRQAMPPTSGVASEMAPPPVRRGEPAQQPHSIVGQGLMAQADEVPAGRAAGVNVMQPGQLDPTIAHSLSTQTESPPGGPPRPPTPPQRPPTPEIERPGVRNPDWQGAPAPIPRNQQVMQRPPDTTQGMLQEPPVRPGMARLYATDPRTPRAFTTNRATAEPFGPLRHVDVPHAQLATQFQPGRDPGSFVANRLWESPAYQRRVQPTREMPTQPTRRPLPPGGEPPPPPPGPPPARGGPAAAERPPTGVRVATPQLNEAVARAVGQPAAGAPRYSREQANALANRRDVLNREAAIRGMTPEALRVEARAILKSHESQPAPTPAPAPPSKVEVSVQRARKAADKINAREAAREQKVAESTPPEPPKSPAAEPAEEPPPVPDYAAARAREYEQARARTELAIEDWAEAGGAKGSRNAKASEYVYLKDKLEKEGKQTDKERNRMSNLHHELMEAHREERVARYRQNDEYRALADRMDKDIHEWNRMDEIKEDIDQEYYAARSRGEPGDAAKMAAEAAPDAEPPLAKAAKAVRPRKAAPAADEPLSLHQHIKKLGGIKPDDKGEVAGIFGDRKTGAYLQLVRKNGLPLDRIVENVARGAPEERYLHEGADINDLKNALRENAGRDHYPAGEEGHVPKSRQERYAEENRAYNDQQVDKFLADPDRDLADFEPGMRQRMYDLMDTGDYAEPAAAYRKAVEENEKGRPVAEEPTPKPAAEKGAEGKPQEVMFAKDEKTAAQRAADAPLKPKEAQKGSDFGMFADRQEDIFDRPAAKPKEESSAKVPADDASAGEPAVRGKPVITDIDKAIEGLNDGSIAQAPGDRKNLTGAGFCYPSAAKEVVENGGHFVLGVTNHEVGKPTYHGVAEHVEGGKTYYKDGTLNFDGWFEKSVYEKLLGGFEPLRRLTPDEVKQHGRVSGIWPDPPSLGLPKSPIDALANAKAAADKPKIYPETEAFAQAQKDYRARKIGDDEFLAAKAKYEAWLKETGDKGRPKTLGDAIKDLGKDEKGGGRIPTNQEIRDTIRKFFADERGGKPPKGGAPPAPPSNTTVVTHLGTQFKGADLAEAAAFAKAAGFKPHQIFLTNGQPYTAAKAAAQTTAQTGATGTQNRATAAPSRATPPTATSVAAARQSILDQVGQKPPWYSKLPTSKAEAKQLWRDFYTAAKNAMDPIEQLRKLDPARKLAPEEDFAMLARLTKGMGSRFQQIMKNGTYDITTGKVNGKGLDEVIKPIASDPDGFTAYAMAKRAIELDGRGIKTGINVQNARMVVAADAARFEPVFRDLHAFQDRVLENLVKSGVLSDAAATKMRQLNKEYVPFYRMLDPDSELGQQLGAGLQTRNPIFRIKGSDKDFHDPINSIIKNTYLFTDLAERNRALVQMKKFNDGLPPDKQFMVRDRSSHPIEVQPQEIQKFMDKHGIEGFADDSMTIFRPNAFTPAADKIRLYNNGKAEVYTVPENVGKAINSMDRQSQGLFLKIMATPARMLRAGAIFSPEFIARNPLRDLVGAFIQSKHGSIPVYDFAVGLKHIFKKSQDFQEWQIAGGGNANLVSMDRAMLHTDPYSVKGVANRVVNPVQWYRMLQDLSELSENATRMGMYARARGKGIHPLEAAYEAREGTLDFARMGSSPTMRALNSMIPFFNAQIEGVDRAARAFRDNPIGTTAKVAAAVTTPSVLLWFANKDDERVKELPAWQRDLFWIVPGSDKWVPMTDAESARWAGKDLSRLTHTVRQGPNGLERNNANIWRIPKPFEIGVLFGSVPERLLDAYYNKKPDAFKNLSNTTMQALTPGFVPQAVLPGIEQFANRSMFLDRPLLTEEQKKLPPAQQYGPYTSETAKGIGSVIRAVAGDKSSFGSPAIIDNYLRQWTGGLGKHVVDAIDTAVKSQKNLPPEATRTAADLPGIKAFAARFPSQSAQSIQDFYDTRNDRKMEEAGIKAQQKTDPTGAAERRKGADAFTGEPFAKILAADRAAVKRIAADPKMSPDDKRSAMDLTYLLMIEHAKAGVAAFERTRKQRLERVQ